MWKCGNCHERLEDSFDVCWSCGTSKEGFPDPTFQPAARGDDPVSAEPSPEMGAERTPANDRTCPDCSGALHAIRIIDKAHNGGHTQLEYTLPEARRSFWTGRYEIAGKVTAYLCESCGRIVLYGDAGH